MRDGGRAGGDGPLDGGLDRVGQLVPAAGEELDAVVGHRVVAGRQHDAEVGVERCGEVGDRRGGQHPDAQHLGAGAGQAATTAASSISRSRGGRGRRPRRDARSRRGRRARWQPLGPPPGPTPASGRRWPDHGRRRCRRGDPRPVDQRLEYWGALRAFFRPYFLRSMTRGSRVRKPARLRAGRSSGSTSISARAMARRSAPACRRPRRPRGWRRRRTARPSPGW